MKISLYQYTVSLNQNFTNWRNEGGKEKEKKGSFSFFRQQKDFLSSLMIKKKKKNSSLLKFANGVSGGEEPFQDASERRSQRNYYRTFFALQKKYLR